MSTPSLAFLVPPQHVKSVKTILEEQGKLDRRQKISPYQDEANSTDKKFIVPVALDTEAITDGVVNRASIEETKSSLLQQLGPGNCKDISIIEIPASEQPFKDSKKNANPLQAAVRNWIETLPDDLLKSLNLHADELVSALPTTYTIYPPMLLLPATTFKSASWQTLLPALSQPTTNDLYTTIASSLHTTHIALNAPIAPYTSITSITSTTSTSSTPPTTENILRTPSNITPLHGPFGPPPTPRTLTAPTAADYGAAFWATARQNGIAQTWAPRYTMFSRGNVKEKARVLGLGSVKTAAGVERAERGRGRGERERKEGEGKGKGEGEGCTVVDLYAGIGYFAFSYRAAGARRVLGWELNPWSVEGLRRGAEMNGWGVRVVDEGDEGNDDEDGQTKGTRGGVEVGEEDFLIFRESNVHATGRIRAMRSALPPIRHVNCGLLPTSRGSWEIAVEAVDPGLGGWIHLHENFAVAEIEKKAEETLAEIQKIVERVRETRQGDASSTASDATGKAGLEHVERVKTYAPGVMHCVMDILIPPTAPSSM